MAGSRVSIVEGTAGQVPRCWRLERLSHPELEICLATARDPAGELLVAVGLSGPASIEAHARRHGATLERHPKLPGSRALAQLREYLAGAREDFDLRVLALGSAFEREAWQALLRIRFGHTSSYGEQARAIGRPGAARAIGRANGRNPVPIVIPCHRVIGRDGTLTGFAGGLALKRWLLAHEGVRLCSEAGPRLAPKNQLALF